MADVNLPLPFEAYVGPDPFVFVSYAHKDGQIVFPLLKSLHSERYRIWYDEGIDPGNEWPDEIAKALDNADFFLVFISKSAVQSQNVRNEINYALNKEKAFLAVHIEDVALPPGLELRMGDIQAILKWRMTDDHYVRKLTKTFPDSLRDKEMETISYEKGSVFRWWKVLDSGHGGEDVEFECVNCGGKRSHDPAFGDKPTDSCPACGFDGAKPSEAPWYVARHEGMGDRSYTCRKCRNAILVTHYESEFQVPTQCPECGFSK